MLYFPWSYLLYVRSQFALCLRSNFQHLNVFYSIYLLLTLRITHINSVDKHNVIIPLNRFLPHILLYKGFLSFRDTFAELFFTFSNYQGNCRFPFPLSFLTSSWFGISMASVILHFPVVRRRISHYPLVNMIPLTYLEILSISHSLL